MSSSFFITGCVRSGTTLLEKLLCNHAELSVLSQPLPVLYIKIKQAFLKTKNIKDYFVLSNYVNETRYSFKEFDSYLNTFEFSSALIEDAIKSSYSGKLTSTLKSSLIGKNNLAFIYNRLMQENSHKEGAKLYGSKEVLCEEFAPYFMNHNMKVLHIIRDPRDVVSSIKKGSGGEYVGNIKPLLFELRNWRKSAQLALQCRNHQNFLSIHYEDLVLETEGTLEKICKFLNINSFDRNVFKKGIKDQNGTIWSSNSSFEINESIVSSKSIGRHKQLLTEHTNEYITNICLPEYSMLSNKQQSTAPNMDIISAFCEPVRVSDENINPNYSTTEQNIRYEIKRLKLFLSKQNFFEFEVNDV
jgi:hypothetical protein